MVKKSVFGSIGIVGFAAILFGMHTAGWLPMVQAQGDELQQMIQTKPDAQELARHLVLFYQGELRAQLNTLADAKFESSQDPANIKKRDTVTVAEIAVAVTQVEIKNQYSIWKGTQ